MNNSILVLAQSSALEDPGPNGVSVISKAIATHLDVLNHPDSLSDLLLQIHLVWAVIFILVGMACVLNGYRWHKTVVVVLAAMSGVWAGYMLGQQMGNSVIAGVCLASLFAVLAWPMLRFAVALFGGLAGAFAGANMWTAMELDPSQHKVGAMIGLVLVGMLAFMAFRSVVIVMTTIGGASLLVFGVLASLMHIESLQTGLLNTIQNNQNLVPLVAASAAAVGAVIQFSGGFKGMSSLAQQADMKRVVTEKKAA